MEQKSPEQKTERLKPAEQVIHVMNIKVLDAVLERDEKDFIKYSVLTNQQKIEEQGGTKIKKSEKQLETYAKIFFGAERERQAQIKYFDKLKQQKLEESIIISKQNKPKQLSESIIQKSMIADDDEPIIKPVGQQQNFSASTKISSGHLKPQWNETLSFMRTTENYFTIAIYQNYAEKLKNIQYSWQQQKFDNEQLLIAEGRVDFSKFVKNQKSQKEQRKVCLVFNGEDAGYVNIELEYIDSKKPEKKEAPVETSDISLNKPSITYFEPIPEKFQNFDAQFIIKSDDKQIFSGIIKASRDSLQWEEILEFKIRSGQKKVQFQVNLTDKETRFQEIAGIASVETIKFKEGDKNNMQVEMYYRGKLGAALSFNYDCKIPEPQDQSQTKKRLLGSTSVQDIKLLSKPTEKDLKIQLEYQKKQEWMSQKFHQFVPPKEKEYQTPQYKPSFEYYFNTKKEEEGIQLPKIKTKEGYIEPINPVMQIKRFNDKQYHNGIYGQGFSNLNSVNSLKTSSPHYSIMPKSERFPNTKPEKQTPGHIYGQIGLNYQSQELDEKLNNQRKQNFQDYIRKKQAFSIK